MCGELHVDAIRERLSYPEIVGWMNYFREKQQAIEKTEFYLVQLTAAVSGIFGGDVEPADLLIDWGGEAGEPVKLEMEDLALTLAHALGAKIIDKRGTNGK